MRRRANLWACLVGIVATLGCGTHIQRIPSTPPAAHAPPPKWDGIQYPLPQPVQAGAPQAPPARRMPDGESEIGAWVPDAAELATAVGNAAVRDDETLRLARDYAILIDLIFRRSPARTASAGVAYDGAPLRQLHAELHDDLETIRVRAAVLGQQYRTLAARWGIDLQEAPMTDDSRAGRLRELITLCTCTQSDVTQRLASADPAVPGGPADGTQGHDRALRQLSHDVALLSATAGCSKVVHRVLRRS